MREGMAARSYVAGSKATHLTEAVKEVWRLLRQGIEFSGLSEPKFQAELRELAAPHMPVLVHKRAKVGATTGTLEDEQWIADLDDFVSRMLWPHVQNSVQLKGRNKHCVAELMDEIVAAEQRTMSDVALADIIPRTSRFDTSWAT